MNINDEVSAPKALGLIFGAVAVAVVGIIVGVAIAEDDASESTARSSSRSERHVARTGCNALGLGQYGRLGGDATPLDQVPLFRTSDIPATRAAFAAHISATAPPHTKVQVGDRDGSVLLVELSEGAHAGRAGWVPCEWVVP